MASGPDMYRCFWTPDADTIDFHVCKSCGHRRKQNTRHGYSNLISHLKASHVGWEQVVAVHCANGIGPMDAFARQVSAKAINLYGWLEWTLEQNHSFRFCEKKLTRKYSTLTALTTKTLMKYVTLTAASVRNHLSNMLPESFGLVIDGWSQDSLHFSGIYAVYVSNAHPMVVQEFLLSCNVAEDITDETDFVDDLADSEKGFGFSAEDWFDILVDALQIYGIDITVHNCNAIIEFLCADNCSTNRSLSTKAGIPLIGCYSHKLNLAINDLIGNKQKKNSAGAITQHEDGDRPLLSKLDKLMGQLGTLKNSSLLRAKTPLLPQRKNAIRWASLFNMLVKWKRIREFVMAIDEFPADTVAKIPTSAENSRLSILLDELKCFESVSKALQGGGLNTLTLYEARKMFDKLLDDFGQYPLSQLKANSVLVNNPPFENGVIKIQSGNEDRMSRAEKDAVSRYLKPAVAAAGNAEKEGEPPAQHKAYADRVLSMAQQDKRQRIDTSKYRTTIHVLPQSNLCERLFSHAKIIMSDRRKHMKPQTLNDVLLLKANRQLWGPGLIQAILNAQKEAGDSDNDEDDGDEDDSDYYDDL